MSVSSLRFITNLFTSQSTPQSEAETSDRILRIVNKLKHHTDLSSQDESFLERSTHLSPSWGNYALSFIVTPSDQRSCEMINHLSQEVLN